MSDSLQHPVALVTGASRGLGAATARALARSGADVIITYRQNADAAAAVVADIEAAGRRAHAFELDVTDPASFAAFATQVAEQLPDGHLDILVNNAGGALYRTLDVVTEAEVDRVIAEHVKGPLFLTQALLPSLGEGSQIINISSALARVAMPASGPYGAAKAALEAITRYQAREFGARGITANVVAPGAVPTDFGDGHLRSDEGLQQIVIQNTALGRLATPEDIGALIAGLTLGSGHWFTGQRVEASGGMLL